MVQSPVQSDSKDPPQSDGGTVNAHNVDSSLAQSTLVANFDVDADGIPDAAPASTGFSDGRSSFGPGGGMPGVAVRGVPLIRSIFQKHGIPEEVVSATLLRFKGGATGTTLTSYDSRVRRYCGIAASLRIDDPLDFAPTNVARVLAHMISLKRAWSTIRGTLHAVSSVGHMVFPNRPKLSDDSVIRNILEGQRRLHPPKPTQPSQYYNLRTIFDFVARIDILTCDLQSLRRKMMFLLMCDAMCRPSDLACIDRDSIKFFSEPDRFVFEFMSPKEQQHKARVPMLIQGVTDQAVCTCYSMRQYIRRTKGLDIVTIARDGFKFRPLFIGVPPKKTSANMIAIGSDRIGNIITELIADAIQPPKGSYKWTAKSIRGAASSKVVNMGNDSNRVLFRARWGAANTFIQYYKKYYQQGKNLS